MSVLVTGGAGYIGAHLVQALQARTEDVVVVDDLSSGVAERVEGARLVRLDLADPRSALRLASLMREQAVDSVVHLAGKKRVDESITNPVLYYRENVGGLVSILGAMESAEVRHIVFSSSAAVYGEVDRSLVDEDSPPRPSNPYGATKLAGEWLLRAADAAGRVRGCSLRYFNVAGTGSPALADRGATNLIPIVVRRLLDGSRPQIYGVDHATPDGTCLRDYIHVVDLVEAHLAVLDAMREGRCGAVYNVGTGVGTSVRAVIEAVQDRLGTRVESEILPRRSGDPDCSVADATRIREEIGWRSRFGLDDIVRSAAEVLSGR